MVDNQLARVEERTRVKGKEKKKGLLAFAAAAVEGAERGQSFGAEDAYIRGNHDSLT